MSGGIVDCYEEIVEGRVETLCHSSVEVLNLISHGRSFLESLPLLEYFPDYFRREDLALEGIGYLQAQGVQLFREADVLARGGHFLSDKGGDIGEGDFAFAVLKADFLKESEEAISEVEVFLLGGRHDFPEDA